MAYLVGFAKEIFQSREPGGPPLNLESLKTRITVSATPPDQLQILLFTAIEMVNLDLVRFLIEEQHVDPNYLHTRHFHPLGSGVTVMEGMNPISVLYVLFTSQSPLPIPQMTEMFLYLVENVNPETIKHRIETPSPTTSNGTVLHYLSSPSALVKFDVIRIVRRLCEKAPGLIDMQSDAGSTALHVAAQYNNVEVVRELIRLGVDLTLRDRSNKTPRDLATSVEIRALLDSALNPAAPPGSPPRGPAAAGAGSPPGPGSPASPPYTGSPSDPQGGRGGRRTRRKRSKRRKTRGRRRS